MPTLHMSASRLALYAGFKLSFCDSMSATQELWWQPFLRKAPVFFYNPVTKLPLSLPVEDTVASVALVKTLPFVSSPHMSSKDKGAVGYLSDACCMTCRQGVMGGLVSCRGSGVARALLQLVPQLGHLRAEWRWKMNQESPYFILKKARGYSLFPSGAVNVSCYQWEGVGVWERVRSRTTD